MPENLSLDLSSLMVGFPGSHFSGFLFCRKNVFCEHLHNMMAQKIFTITFYRTQVNLGSDVQVRGSLIF